MNVAGKIKRSSSSGLCYNNEPKHNYHVKGQQ